MRPGRRSGFRVKTEKFENKTVIHNYGHGSRGVTLSWGTSHLAVEEALRTVHTRYAVLGCGAVGLATARLLQRRGFDVTIYAKDVPPNTTSNIAGAQWDAGRLPADATPEFKDQYTRALRLSYRYFQGMVGDYYGVRWVEDYAKFDPNDQVPQELREFYPDYKELSSKEHPFGSFNMCRWFAMLIEPPIYLNAVMRDFLMAGGKIVVRDFANLQKLLALPEAVILNCTGLGAKALFGDEEVYPVKGQLTVLLPQPEIDYMTDVPGMFPRKDGILLGGTWEPGVWTLEPNREEMQKVMNRHMEFFKRMK